MTIAHESPPVQPCPAVSAGLVHQGKVLMVRRRNPPNADRLAMPGGRVASGESLYAAAVRELREETGVVAEPTRVLTAIDELLYDEAGGLLHHYVIVVVVCRWISGMGVADDDASEIHWLDGVGVRDEPTICANARKIAARLLEEGGSAM
ncbi:NUDIX hydrolase [Billgrantia endophytica]|uniref:ADP-ribose pyrophosphatase n=1 Tax=Billgrantia endophytica TaxID=2033802 RepID=A0A2N7UAG6_9GAMM|nr:NUDIX hydrolase [Halomonas endophytica]PMR77437.1 ADP-ribose pyrophosphatase [Halomonas endophytica]